MVLQEEVQGPESRCPTCLPLLPALSLSFPLLSLLLLLLLLPGLSSCPVPLFHILPGLSGFTASRQIIVFVLPGNSILWTV